MRKKYVFVDVDGTLIDHSTRLIPESSLYAIKTAQNNGHEIIICTGRPPCLLYDIDKRVGVNSYVAANGRYAVHKGEVILSETIPTDVIHRMAKFAEENGFDIAYEGISKFRRSGNHSDLYLKFSDSFDLEIPEVEPDFYLTNDVFQITLYSNSTDYKIFEKEFPELLFAVSNEYGIDVNTKGGWKDQGIKAFVDRYSLEHQDLIVIGDGFNDISMFNYVETSIAMGNAKDEVKKHAKFVTDDVDKDGLYKAFEMLKLI